MRRAYQAPGARRSRRLVFPVGVAVSGLALVLTGCGGSTDSGGTGTTTSAASPTGTPVAVATVCASAATPVTVPSGVPSQAALPDGYVVTSVEERSGSRFVVSAVSPKDFKSTLSDMQKLFSTNGWTPSQGEVEEDDAESNFSGNGLVGRWAIRAIEECDGNTTVSVVTGPAS